MQTIINFIIRHRVFLFYLLLLFFSLVFTIQSHSYRKSKFINSANFLSGGLYESMSNVSNYFNLKKQNKLLQEENNQLKTILFNKKIALPVETIDSLIINQTNKYKFTPAQVIKNSYTINNNVLLINKGRSDGFKQDFGVITSKGILGIIDNTNSGYSTVLSILNTASRISCQLKTTNHFGSLSWNGNSPQIVQLTEIPKQAPIKKGDTIITSGRSAIFPKGVPVGSVDNFSIDKTGNYYNINVKLFNDMTNIEHVYVIQNNHIEAIKSLLNPEDE